MKNVRAVKTSLLAFLLTAFLSGTSQVMAADLGSLSYWDSDGEAIGRWSKSGSFYLIPDVRAIKLNSTSSVYVHFSHAVDQWKTALGYPIFVSNDPVTSSSGMGFWGGTISEINALGVFSPVPSGINGSCTTNFSIEGTWKHGTMNKDGRLLSKARGYVVESNRTANEYKNTSTHELGHALGWSGHSSGASTIMYAYGSSVISLTNTDTRHLKQVYP
ncbi:MAG: matrixin family metalloprotease [Oscillospiraceae bacterium]|nr:matrixin family metalloprotease [Oscillospiraceae bacterium]